MEGTAQCAVDGARVRIPTRFRAELGSGPLVVSRGLSSCLFVFSIDEYSRVRAAIAVSANQGARSFGRFLTAQTMQVGLDARCRLSVSPHLMQYAGIGDRVIWSGEGTYLEIWDKDRFDSWVTSGERRSTLRGLLAAIESAS